MKTTNPDQFNPLRFAGVRLGEKESFKSLGGADRWLLGEPIVRTPGGVQVGPVPKQLRYTVPPTDSSVGASAIHVEFALTEPNETGFLGFAHAFGRLGVEERLDLPVSSSGQLFSESAEHFDTWVDCHALMRLGLALAWFDPHWQEQSQVDVDAARLDREDRQRLARSWLGACRKETTFGRAADKTPLERATGWQSVTVETRRYQFSSGEHTWRFEGGGGLLDDSARYRDAMLAALANDAVGRDVALISTPEVGRFKFEVRTLWALMWLQCLTQARAHIDYRWCLHCGTIFAAPYKRSDRLFCSVDCTRANHAWREEESIRLARDGLSVIEIVERTYDPRQLESPKKRANAEGRVRKWIAG